ncbi:hypothetical protein [Cerasicoccus maritimus]|uniref:hypothetical protein n=1 Tax=Cerasicoccus maritimus TaxID=490089 RepID=UPI0028525F46|nr:hypothetical protein [Cerasicoccus maritimus]
MFIFRHEKAEIARLQEEISRERTKLAADTRELLPQAKKAAAMGSAVLALRRIVPLLRPVVVAGAQRSFSKRRRKRIFKLVALGAAAFGAYKLLGNGEHAEDATEEA